MIPHVLFAPTSNSMRCTSHRFKRNAANTTARAALHIKIISISTFISIPFPCHSWSMQFLRYVLRCISFAYQFHSLHLLAFAMHRLSTPSQISSIRFIAFAPRLCTLPRHCDSLLLHALPLLIKATPCIHSRFCSLLFHALPCLCRFRQISASPLPLKSLRLQALP